jgi:glycosyltransferase involved in cell wall biosynthesis
MTNEVTSRRAGTSQPAVSVITPFLNPGVFLAEAIQSVFAQTHCDWELLLVDDGTTDGATDVARGYAARHPDRVFYLEHAGHRNRGTPASRNLGIKRARGNYIAFLDADDVWMPEKLSEQLASLETHPNVAMTYGPGINWHSWNGESSEEVQDYPQNVGVSGNTVIVPPCLLEIFMESDDVVPSPSGILVRRSSAVSVGGFVERFRGRQQVYEDQSFYVKLAMRENVLITDRPCFLYRQHPGSCCAQVVRSNDYNKLRIDYLRWLSNYLAETYADDMKIRAVVAKELSQLRAAYVRASLGKVAHQVLPSGLLGWLRSRVGGCRV